MCSKSLCWKTICKYKDHIFFAMIQIIRLTINHGMFEDTSVFLLYRLWMITGAYYILYVLLSDSILLCFRTQCTREPEARERLLVSVFCVCLEIQSDGVNWEEITIFEFSESKNSFANGKLRKFHYSRNTEFRKLCVVLALDKKRTNLHFVVKVQSTENVIS